MSSIPQIHKGLKLTGKSGTLYTLSTPLVQRSHPHVWKAFRSDNERDELIIKHPQDNTPSEMQGFHKEMKMQTLFNSSPHIRRMIDVIPASSNFPGMMVLEPFEKTLWAARTQRPLTTQEIKHTMKLALLGLRDIHKKGLVYCDFKMENVLLNRFDNSAASNDESIPLRINAKLSDLGSVMAPDHGEVAPLTYRSPEVYFQKPWTSAIDIWAWGIAYFHLLQAQINFTSPGIYDSIIKDRPLEQKAKAVQASQVHDFNLRTNEYYQDCDFSVIEDVVIQFEEEHWTDRLVALGVPEYDVMFLYAVLEPDLTKRMTAEDILILGILMVTSDMGNT